MQWCQCAKLMAGKLSRSVGANFFKTVTYIRSTDSASVWRGSLIIEARRTSAELAPLRAASRPCTRGLPSFPNRYRSYGAGLFLFAPGSIKIWLLRSRFFDGLLGRERRPCCEPRRCCEPRPCCERRPCSERRRCCETPTMLRAPTMLRTPMMLRTPTMQRTPPMVRTPTMQRTPPMLRIS